MFFWRMKKSTLVLFLLLGALSMLMMSLHYFQSVDTGILRAKPASRSAFYLFLFYIHISGGLLAMLLGPFQFIPSWRKKHPKLHQWLGIGYFAGIFSSGLAGVCIAPFAMGGTVAQTGFFVLAVVWLLATSLGMRTLVQGQFQEHGRWMIRSYALTFATIPQRTMLLLALITPINFYTIYQLSAWLPWIFQLLLAEWVIRRLYGRRERSRDLALSDSIKV